MTKKETPAEVMVHIVLHDSVRAGSATLENAVNQLLKVSGLHDINEKRLRRYGILSGWVVEEKIPAIESCEAVASVSRDEERGIVSLP